jgi:hypothetical protein
MTTESTPLTVTDERTFRAAFPKAVLCKKEDDPSQPNVAFFLPVGTSPKIVKYWGKDGAPVDVPCPADTHVLLLNGAVDEVYPCEIGNNGHPVGYAVAPTDRQTLKSGTVYISEPIWAVKMDEAVVIRTKENFTAADDDVFECPAGGYLAFSDSKGLYHVKADKWVKMGYAPVTG